MNTDNITVGSWHQWRPARQSGRHAASAGGGQPFMWTGSAWASDVNPELAFTYTTSEIEQDFIYVGPISYA